MTPISIPASLEVLRVSPDAIIPTRAHPGDAGMDLYGLEDVILGARQGKMARTGIAMAIPHGFVGMIADRSSLGKKGVKTAGGIVDAGYRGEVQVILWNLTDREILLAKGERIAQMLIYSIATPAVVEVGSLDETKRGAGGFGSTGK